MRKLDICAESRRSEAPNTFSAIPQTIPARSFHVTPQLTLVCRASVAASPAMYPTASPAATSGGSGSTMVSLDPVSLSKSYHCLPVASYIACHHCNLISTTADHNPSRLFRSHDTKLGLIAFQLIQSRGLSSNLATLSLVRMDGGSLPRAYLAYQASYVAAKEFYSILLSWPR